MTTSDRTQRKKRADAHRRAMEIFESLPQVEDPDAERNEMWALGTRVLIEAPVLSKQGDLLDGKEQAKESGREPPP